MRGLPAAAAFVIVLGAPCRAQTYAVTGISPVTSFGEVATAASGDTVFFQNNTTVSTVSGQGAYIKGTVRRATVTVRCTASGSPNPCGIAGNNARIKIGSLSNSGGRAKEFTEFIATGVTGTLSNGTTTGPVLEFDVSGFTGNNNTRTFTLDTKLRVTGDNDGSATGALTSTYYVYAAKSPTTPTSGMTLPATITVRKSLRIVTEQMKSLRFGSLVRQPSGTSATVTINQTTGARSTSGNANMIPVSTVEFGRAEIPIIGEPGTTFSLVYNPTGNIVMSNVSGGGGTLSVTTTKTNTGTVTLPTPSGSMVLGIGGTITVLSTTARGQYSGSITVTVTYN